MAASEEPSNALAWLTDCLYYTQLFSDETDDLFFFLAGHNFDHGYIVDGQQHGYHFFGEIVEVFSIQFSRVGDLQKLISRIRISSTSPKMGSVFWICNNKVIAIVSPLCVADDNAQLQSSKRKCITIVQYRRCMRLRLIPVDPRAVDRAQIGHSDLGFGVDGGVQA